ncbi:MAG: hypothetical protein KAJ51_01505 [Thermoplasmata archaeon]|nr:hypothetical protein [Thermoplasmata archaeon]
MKVPENFRSNLLVNLDNLGLENIWELRGDLQVLKNYIIQNTKTKDGIELADINALLDVSGNLYNFLLNIKGSITSADYNKLARFFNAGGDTLSELEELLTKEDIRIPELIMEGLAVLLNFTGNTAYITSALEGCETHIMTNSMIVHDKLWVLVHNYKKDTSPQELENINHTMNTFFYQFSNRNIPLPDRITIIARLYQFLCTIYLVKIIRELKWVEGA